MLTIEYLHQPFYLLQISSVSEQDKIGRTEITTKISYPKCLKSELLYLLWDNKTWKSDQIICPYISFYIFVVSKS